MDYIYVNFCLENKEHLVLFAVNISIYYKPKQAIQTAKKGRKHQTLLMNHRNYTCPQQNPVTLKDINSNQAVSASMRDFAEDTL